MSNSGMNVMDLIIPLAIIVFGCMLICIAHFMKKRGYRLRTVIVLESTIFVVLAASIFLGGYTYYNNVISSRWMDIRTESIANLETMLQSEYAIDTLAVRRFIPTNTVSFNISTGEDITDEICDNVEILIKETINAHILNDIINLLSEKYGEIVYENPIKFTVRIDGKNDIKNADIILN
jgi:hypothetical protein